MLDLAQVFEDAADTSSPDDDRELIASARNGSEDYTAGYALRENCRTEIEIQDGTTTCSGQLRDLSATGVKLSTCSELNVGDAVGLVVTFVEHGIEIRREAVVSWVGLYGQQDRIVGCSFAAEQIDSATLRQLAALQCLECRNVERVSVYVDARVRSVEIPSWQIAVRLRDLSSGGFGMSSPCSMQIGTRLLLEVSGAPHCSASIPAEVRWCNKSSKGYTVGCRFLLPTDLQLFDSSPPPARRFWSFGAICARLLDDLKAWSRRAKQRWKALSGGEIQERH